MSKYVPVCRCLKELRTILRLGVVLGGEVKEHRTTVSSFFCFFVSTFIPLRPHLKPTPSQVSSSWNTTVWNNWTISESAKWLKWQTSLLCFLWLFFVHLLPSLFAILMLNLWVDLTFGQLTFRQVSTSFASFNLIILVDWSYMWWLYIIEMFS